MQRIAVAWLVYSLSNSAFLLGVIGFLGQFPTFLMAPFSGVFADRWNRYQVLFITQSLAMLQAFALTALVLTNTVTIWHIIVLTVFLAVVNAFEMPTRQAFVVEMVDKKEDLVNAIAMNSAMFNAARLIGPSVAGIVIAAAGIGICFLLNAISFLSVIIALIFMRITARKLKRESKNVMQGLVEGFKYVVGNISIRSVLMLVALGSLLGMPYAILAPVFARDILHGGAHALGFLMAASGVGALTGAVMLAARKSPQGLEKVIPMAIFVLGLGLVGFGLSRMLWLSLITMVFTGFGMMVEMASGNTILQTVVDDDKRGRVMSFYAMAFMGTAPLGSLMAGALAGKIGAPYTMVIFGLGCILGSVVLGRKLFALKELIPAPMPQVSPSESK
jgi:MFS family permease